MKTKKNIKKILILFIAVFSLQSCFVAKQYQRPDIETEYLYRDISISDSSSLAIMPWNNLFVDIKLQNLVNLSLSNNLDLLMAVERVNASEAYLKQGRMAFLPSLNLGVNAGKYNNSDNSMSGIQAGGDGPSFENYKFNGSISWEADIWGKINSQKKSARALYLKSKAAKRAVESKLIASVVSAYYQLVSLDAQVKLTDKTIANRIESLETMKSLKSVGRVSETAVKQTEAQMYSTHILALDLKEKVNLLENTISILLGNVSGSIIRGKLNDQNVSIDMKTGFASELLSNRPDVMMAEYDLISAFELTNVARSDFYPKMKITALGGLESLKFDDWFNTASIFNNIIGNITQPLFNKRKLKTQYEVAMAKKNESQLKFKKSLLLAGKEVSDVLYVYQSEKLKYQYREKELAALVDAVSFSEQLLEVGYLNTTYLEVLTAKNNALMSEMNLINSKYKQLNAMLGLYIALGGGWNK